MVQRHEDSEDNLWITWLGQEGGCVSYLVCSSSVWFSTSCINTFCFLGSVRLHVMGLVLGVKWEGYGGDIYRGRNGMCLVLLDLGF